MDETFLIKSAMNGDLESFNRLVLAYQDAAYNTAWHLLNDDFLAADAVQDAFISAWRHIPTFRGGSFKAWIMRMVINGCYDELRRQKRRPTTRLEPFNDQNEEENDSPQWIASDEPSPETSLEQIELEHALQHCLENLPADFRTVLVLVDVQGMDYEEVSQTAKTPLGTVKSRLARGRMKVRDCLKGFEELLPAQYRLKGEALE